MAVLPEPAPGTSVTVELLSGDIVTGEVIEARESLGETVLEVRYTHPTRGHVTRGFFPEERTAT